MNPTEFESFPWKFPSIVVRKMSRLFFQRHVGVNRHRIAFQQDFETCLCVTCDRSDFLGVPTKITLIVIR